METLLVKVISFFFEIIKVAYREFRECQRDFEMFFSSILDRFTKPGF